MRDEACLTLTVWSPDPGAVLPVMVWIPGGAFVYGAGQLQLYNGSKLAANGDVVVVNVTYRLGVFGGFELGDLGPGFDDNLALRDQVAALQWVRDNIRAFGGDPEQVTVFGESAGATSVLALLASPLGEGLFRRAIAQSPALPLIADRETRARQARTFVERLGVTVDELKSLPQRRLRRAAGQLQGESAADTPTLAYGLDLRRGLTAEASDRRRAGRSGVADPVDRRYQQPRGVDVRVGQAADAADHAVDRRRLLRADVTRGKGPSAGRVSELSATQRAHRVWFRHHVRRSDVGVRRRLLGARTHLRLPLRPRRVEPATARPRRHARQ